MARQASRSTKAGKPERACIEGRVADAVVVGKAGEKDALEAAFAQVAGEAGRRGAVILEEGGVRVDGAAEALAQDELGVGQMEIGMKFRSLVSPGRSDRATASAGRSSASICSNGFLPGWRLAKEK